MADRNYTAPLPDSHSDSDVAAIAAKLTKAQRRRLEALCVLYACRKSWISGYGSVYLSSAVASSDALVDLGLIERRYAARASTGRWLDRGKGQPTELGLAVRAHLQQEQPQ